MSEFLNTCRTCLTKTTKLTSLDKKINLDGETLDLSDLLYKCVSLQIEAEESLPQKMCIDCVSKLSRAFTFRKQCWEADALLRSEDFREERDNDFEDIIIKEEEINSADSFIMTYNVDETGGLELNCIDNIQEEHYDSSTSSNFSIKGVKGEVAELRADNIITEFVAEEDCDIELDFINEPNVSKCRNTDKECEGLCAECGIILNTKVKYLNHMRSHNNQEFKVKRREQESGSFNCTVCEKVFAKLQQFKRHMKLHDPKNPNKCHICDRVFIGPSLLENHIYSHTGERPFKCDICGKTTKNRADLNTHMRFHIGERKFKCTFCEKAFITASHCRAHEKTHNNENDFECVTCNKLFKSKRVLKQHHLLHDKSKHIKCSICDKTFATSKHILSHMLKHSEFIPFSCEHCGRNFLSLPTLETHVRIHHSTAVNH